MPGLSYSLVSRTGPARTVAAIDGRPEVTVPTACTGAMVASTAYVEAGAQVGDRSRIGAGSWLDLDVIVAEDVVVTGNVHLGPSSCVPHGFDNESRTHRHPSRPGPDLLCGGGSALHPVLGVPLARTLDQAAMRTAMRKGQAVCGWIGRPGPVATSRHSHSSTVSLPS